MVEPPYFFGKKAEMMMKMIDHDTVPLDISISVPFEELSINEVEALVSTITDQLQLTTLLGLRIFMI